MSNPVKLIVFIILCLTCGLHSPATYAAKSLSFCVENTEFPPFNYFERQNGHKKMQSDGYDIDILALTFQPLDIKYKVIALPWRRCLKAVKLGLIDGAMSASLNPQRRADYHTSDAYYFLTPSFFYLKNTFSEQNVIENMHDLSGLGSVCGIQGFNYVNFGWNSTEQLHEIKSLSQLPSMLAKKRCSFFLARQETLSGILALNQMHEFEGTIIGRKVPNALPEPFHMLVSRKSKHTELILSSFNQRIAELKTTNQLEGLLQKHLDKLKQ